jgi:hypothetical protein
VPEGVHETPVVRRLPLVAPVVLVALASTVDDPARLHLTRG